MYVCMWCMCVYVRIHRLLAAFIYLFISLLICAGNYNSGFSEKIEKKKKNQFYDLFYMKMILYSQINRQIKFVQFFYLDHYHYYWHILFIYLF